MRNSFIKYGLLLFLFSCQKERLVSAYLHIKNNTNQDVSALIFNGYDNNSLYKSFRVKAHSTLYADTFLKTLNSKNEEFIIYGEEHASDQTYWQVNGFYLVYLFNDGRSSAFPKNMHSRVLACDTNDYNPLRNYPCDFRIIDTDSEKKKKGYKYENCVTTTCYITNQDLYYAQ